MPDELTLSILIPLIAVIVIEMSGIARSINVRTAVREEHPSLGYAFEQKVPLLASLEPSLGKFPFIHNLNSILLMFTLVLVTVTSTGTVALFLMSVLFLVWIALPVIEIRDYDHLIEQRQRSLSLWYHWTSVTVLFFLMAVLVTEIPWIVDPLPLPILAAGTTIVILIQTTIFFYYVKVDFAS